MIIKINIKPLNKEVLFNAYGKMKRLCVIENISSLIQPGLPQGIRRCNKNYFNFISCQKSAARNDDLSFYKDQLLVEIPSYFTQLICLFLIEDLLLTQRMKNVSYEHELLEGSLLIQLTGGSFVN